MNTEQLLPKAVALTLKAAQFKGDGRPADAKPPEGKGRAKAEDEVPMPPKRPTGAARPGSANGHGALNYPRHGGRPAITSSF